MGKKRYIKHIVLVLILILLTIYSFHFFFNIGFTNTDDFDCYINSLKGGYLLDGKIWARGQGRFFFYYRVFMAFFPYLFDNFLIVKIIQYLPVFLSFIVSALWIKEVFNSNKAGYLAYLFLIVFFSVPIAQFQPPTAYPFLFTTDVFFFICSFYLLVKHYKTSKYRYFVGSIICFFIPFYCFEAYIVLLIPYVLFILFKSNPKLKVSLFFKKEALKKILPPILLTSLFYIIYFSYKLIHPSNYQGNNIATTLNWNAFFDFIFSINNSAYPSYIFFNNPSLMGIHTGIVSNIKFIILHSTYSAYFFSLIAASLCILLLRESSFSKIKSGLIIKLALLLLGVSYALNVILAITPKYSNPSLNFKGYVTTYFAYFGISLFFLLIVLLVWKQLCTRYNFKKLRYIFLFSLFFSIFFLSLTINYSNKVISDDLSLNRNRMELINKSIKNNVYKTLPDKSIIIAPSFYDTESVIIGNKLDGLINKYINTKIRKKQNGKTLYFVESRKQIKKLQPTRHIYTLEIKVQNNTYHFLLRCQK